MSKYQILLEGENFPIIFDGVTQNTGFYTTRRVKAIDETEAEEKAILAVKADDSLISTMDKSIQSNPRLYIRSIHKLNWWARLNIRGYTFFPMNE